MSDLSDVTCPHCGGYQPRRYGRSRLETSWMICICTGDEPYRDPFRDEGPMPKPTEQDRENQRILAAEARRMMGPRPRVEEE